MEDFCNLETDWLRKWIKMPNGVPRAHVIFPGILDIIDPATGRPYPRAIIVDDPDLVNLAHDGKFSTLLRHPLLSDALKDPRIRQALGLD